MMKKHVKGRLMYGGIVLMLVLSFGEVLAQTISTYADFQEKYWYYRYRLRNDFMVVGDGPGMSLPAARRLNNNIHWGETTVYHGYYMGVLGTERKALETPIVNGDINHNHALTTNKREMYYALLAMERLDKKAETHVSTNSSENYNGFFSRDDVPSDFATTHSVALNASYTHDGTVTSVTSDWTSTGHGNRAHEMSKDQLVYVLMGLKLIWLYTPNLVETIYNEDGTVLANKNLHDWAKNLAVKFIDFNMNKSRIKNPILNLNVPRGSLASDIQWPMKQLKRELLGQSILSINILDPDYIAWQAAVGVATNTAITGIGQVDNIHMAVTWGAIAKESMSVGKLNSLANSQGWKPFHRILYDALRHASKNDQNGTLSHLNDAPCQGITHGVSGVTNGSINWHATQRYLKDKDHQKNGQSGKEGYYNGLDYMLLHNLYQIQTNNWIPVFDDQITWNYNNHFYQGLISRFSNDPNKEDVDIVAFNKLYTDIQLSPTADVNAKAAYEITLEPGFEAVNGATFYAYVDFPSCSGNYYRKKGTAVEEFDADTESRLSPGTDEQALLTVYPNPANRIINITSRVPITHSKLLSLDGKVLQELEGQGEQTQFDLSALEAGIYIIQVYAGEQIHRRKVMKTN